MFSANTPNSTSSIMDLFASAQKARTGGSGKTETSNTETTKTANKASNDSLSSLKHLLTRTDSPTSTITTPSTTTPTVVMPEGTTLLVQFKRAIPVKRPLLAAGRGHLLAYGASERRLRIVECVSGGTALIDRPAGDTFVDVAWSGRREGHSVMLAVLFEDGEVLLGRVEAEGDGEELHYRAETSLSFPELGAAEGLAWSNNSTATTQEEHLAAWSNESNEVFFVNTSNGTNSTLFISTQSPVRRVSIHGGRCFVSNQGGVEVFAWNGREFYDARQALMLPSGSDSWVFSDVSDEESLKDNGVFCVSLEEAGGVIKFWAFVDGSKWLERSQLDLDFPVDSVVYHPGSQSLLLFQRGHQQVHLISLKRGLRAPKLVERVFEAPSGVLKISLSPEGDCDATDITMFAYLTDCIIEHSLAVPELEDESEEEEEDEMPIDMDFSTADDEESPVAVSLTVPSSIDSNPGAFDMESLRLMIRETVEECVRDSLAEIIHEAINRSVQGGFEQISRDLSGIVGELIKSVSMASNKSSVLAVPVLPQSPSIQDIRGLIAEGRAGEALVKAASVKDPRLLLEACRQLDDPFAALDREQLSQANLVAIFKLLSLDVDEDTELKLDWLQEVLIQIDLEEAVGESPTLLKDVDTLLGDLKGLVGDSLVDGALQKKMKTVMRLLRKFQIN